VESYIVVDFVGGAEGDVATYTVMVMMMNELLRGNDSSDFHCLTSCSSLHASYLVHTSSYGFSKRSVFYLFT